eukprot:7383397-Prymnesium_polylepis.1
MCDCRLCAYDCRSSACAPVRVRCRRSRAQLLREEVGGARGGAQHEQLAAAAARLQQRLRLQRRSFALLALSATAAAAAAAGCRGAIRLGLLRFAGGAVGGGDGQRRGGGGLRRQLHHRAARRAYPAVLLAHPAFGPARPIDPLRDRRPLAHKGGEVAAARLEPGLLAALGRLLRDARLQVHHQRAARRDRRQHLDLDSDAAHQPSDRHGRRRRRACLARHDIIS